jgi:uncharacterized protein YndB with AHSA1/START domain
MPSFQRSLTAAAPPEEVWKVLYDPSRFPEWWVGFETVEVQDRSVDPDAPVSYTMYPTGYPDFPMPQQLQSARERHSIVISCLVSDLCFDWRLEPLDGGRATRISVHVDIPPSEAHRLESQRDIIDASLTRLADVAAHL